MYSVAYYFLETHICAIHLWPIKNMNMECKLQLTSDLKLRINTPNRFVFLYIFCKRQISIKLFYLYQRLQCRDKYFFKIKFVFFLYLLLSASWNENDLPLYISDIRQILRYQTSVFIQPFPWRLHITITYNLLHLRLWNADAVTVIAEHRKSSVKHFRRQDT